MTNHARRSVPSLCLAAFLGAILLPGLGYSDNSDNAEAAPESPAADAQDNVDRQLMGEFAGPVTVGPNRYQATGLQIRPIGGGSFEAIQYVGGLPGDRSFRGQPVTLIGKRSGDHLVLSGAPWAIFVEQDVCILVDRSGKELGRLQRVVRQSPTLGAAPPKDAMALFDGSGTDHFSIAEMTEDGLLNEGAEFKAMFHDYNLHLEFKLPYMPASKEQARANSGVYLQSRYELQILDSFATTPVFNGCGALYRFRKPDVNMCFPPLQWQTYDIIFTSPRWAADGTKLRNAHVTAWLNGVKVQDDVELPDKTGHGEPEAPVLLPIRLQDHGCPVRYRNIWIIDRGLARVGRFPVEAKPESKPDQSADTAEEQKGKAKKHDDQDKAKKAAAEKDDASADAKQAKQTRESPEKPPQEKPAAKSEKQKEAQKPEKPDPKQAPPAKDKAAADKPDADASKPDAEPPEKAPQEESAAKAEKQKEAQKPENLDPEQDSSSQENSEDGQKNQKK